MAELEEEKDNLGGELSGVEARHEEELEDERADWTKKINDLHANYAKKIRDLCKDAIRHECQRVATTTPTIVSLAHPMVEETSPALTTGGPSECLETDHATVEQV